MLAFNSSQIASTDAEKQIIVAFEESGNADNADAIMAQAQNVRTANAKYQQFLKSSKGAPVDIKISGLLSNLADTFERTAQAIRSNNLDQLDAADRELQSLIGKFVALQAEIKAQDFTDQQKSQNIVDKLNSARKELE